MIEKKKILIKQSDFPDIDFHKIVGVESVTTLKQSMIVLVEYDENRPIVLRAPPKEVIDNGDK